ncbi:hypothetical protein BT93_F2288 [Corymbia citriodora subsp. variegata]|nr:hypothetical protein BT93_F2288 [Corymbia citriodora subsp. variegata]
MGVLCFVADLPALPPETLRRLKQCWLQLANYYAVAPPSSPPPPPRRSTALGDRIALCYVFFDRLTASRHLKVAYSPGEDFDLCRFHRAVGSMPADAFLPDSSTLDRCDTKLLSLLSDESIYSWSSEDIARKIVVLTSSLPLEMDAALHDSLLGAADKCVSVEFLLFETRSVHLRHMQENTIKFVRSISDLDNCSISACLPG